MTAPTVYFIICCLNSGLCISQIVHDMKSMNLSYALRRISSCTAKFGTEFHQRFRIFLASNSMRSAVWSNN